MSLFKGSSDSGNFYLFLTYLCLPVCHNLSFFLSVSVCLFPWSCVCLSHWLSHCVCSRTLSPLLIKKSAWRWSIINIRTRISAEFYWILHRIWIWSLWSNTRRRQLWVCGTRHFFLLIVIKNVFNGPPIITYNWTHQRLTFTSEIQ